MSQIPLFSSKRCNAPPFLLSILYKTSFPFHVFCFITYVINEFLIVLNIFHTSSKLKAAIFCCFLGKKRRAACERDSRRKKRRRAACERDSRRQKRRRAACERDSRRQKRRRAVCEKDSRRQKRRRAVCEERFRRISRRPLT